MLSIFIWFCLCIYGYSKPAHDGTNSQSTQFKTYQNNIISDVNTSPLNERSSDNESKRNVILHGQSADSVNFVRKDSADDGGFQQKRQSIQASPLALPFALTSDGGVSHPPEPTPILIPAEPASAPVGPVPVLLPNNPPVPQPSGPLILQYPSQSAPQLPPLQLPPQPLPPPQLPPPQMPIVLQNQPSCVGAPCPCNPPPNQPPCLVLNTPNTIPCNQPGIEPCGVPPPTPCNIVCNLPNSPPCPCPQIGDQDIHHHEYECLHKHHHYYHHHDVDDDDDNHYNNDDDNNGFHHDDDHGYYNDWPHHREGSHCQHRPYCNNCNNCHQHDNFNYNPSHYNDNGFNDNGGFSSNAHKKSTNPRKPKCHN